MSGPDITPDRVLAEEARIAFADPRAVYGPDGEPKPPHCLDEDTARALAAVEVVESSSRAGGTTVRYKYKFWDKRAALDRLARHLGLAGPAPDPGADPGADPDAADPAGGVRFALNLAGEEPEAGDGEGEDPEDGHAPQ